MGTLRMLGVASSLRACLIIVSIICSTVGADLCVAARATAAEPSVRNADTNLANSATAPNSSSPSSSPLSAAPSATLSGTQPINITADRMQYLQDREIYEADGHVVVINGQQRLTADHMTVYPLTGKVQATGSAHLTNPTSELWGDQLELDMNTEAGIVTNGRLFFPQTNTYATGRVMQRFSEDHYRIKDGTFTNCDAKDGETPAWRFQFEDVDLDAGDSVAMRGGWLCVLDQKLFPVPTLTYPVSYRKSGFLIPQPTYDNRFGFGYRQSYFWAINHSQDLLISPQYYSKLGYGGDVQYRYWLDRQSYGQWLLSGLKQEQLPSGVSSATQSGDPNRLRGLLSGSHLQQINPDFRILGQAFVVSDPSYLQQLSNSGVQRALPSGDSSLLATHRLGMGNAYFFGQYLQPLQSGGRDTFQRLPELGYSMADSSVFGAPVLVGLDSSMVHFYRNTGFQLNRVDVMPGLSMPIMDIGHVLGITPQLKFREIYYTRGIQDEQPFHRQTFWGSIDASSRLSRRYALESGQSLLHTIEPKLVYEYVPPSDQSRVAQIDAIDDLPKKNLLTYSVHSRILETRSSGNALNWLDLTVAQSYRMGGVQTLARSFEPGQLPLFGTLTQPLSPAMTSIVGNKLSDVWIRGIIGNTTPEYIPGYSPLTVDTLSRQYSSLTQFVTFDAFIDPYTGTLSQFNTDLRVQDNNRWYLEVGQRYARDGMRARRGDIWNPISFNEVYAPTPEVQFVTATAAVRLPFGITVGGRAYYDVKHGTSPEYDLVGIYQNPCKCWSLGFYYLQFPDRFNAMVVLSLTGIGWTESFGTAVLKQILTPIMVGERGVPWASVGGPYGRQPTPMDGLSTPAGVTSPANR
ncbi:MAG: LPS assembly protein LptD [Nitrospiraceae bacterium]